MAKIDELGLQTTVLVSGLPAPEFPDEERPSDPQQFGPNTKQSYSYVQSTENAEFSVKFKISSPSTNIKQWLTDDDHILTFDVAIDGVNMGSLNSVNRRFPKNTVRGVTDYSNGLQRKFRFAPISTAITVARSTSMTSIRWEDPKASPLAVFYFKYRSPDDLQKEMIIPRPRSPSILSGKGENEDFASLSQEEVERLARERHAELRGRKRSATVKAEIPDSVPRPHRPYKFIRVEGGKKVIDLTEEDDD